MFWCLIVMYLQFFLSLSKSLSFIKLGFYRTGVLDLKINLLVVERRIINIDFHKFNIYKYISK